MDLYRPCPGGLPKKIKFCCRDLGADLDKLSRMIEGDQRHAATDAVERLLRKHPDRQCLWAIKTTLLLHGDAPEKARDVVTKFRELAPENPIALAAAAIMRVFDESPASDESAPGIDRATVERSTDEMSDLIQQALAASPEYLPMQLYDAISVLAERLLADGRYLSAIQHLSMLAIIAGEDDEEPLQLLAQVQRSNDVPLMLKRGLLLPPIPDSAPWKHDYEQVIKLESEGCWAAAAAQADALHDKYPHEVTLARAAAALHCRLPYRQPAVAALRRLASTADLPEEEAVEAEAIAQLIDVEVPIRTVDQLLAKWTLTSAETALERLQSDPRCGLANVDLEQLRKPDQPPPKALFSILDRPLPTTAEGLTWDTVPQALASAVVYGKQTDCEARLEVISIRGSQDQQATGILQEVLGDCGTPDEEPVVESQLSAYMEKLNPTAVFPPSTPIDVRLELISQLRQHALLQSYPDTPSDKLAGMTPREAAADPAQRIPLQAEILNLAVSNRSRQAPQLLSELRQELGLPTLPLISTTVEQATYLPLPRLMRLDMGLPDDTTLIQLFNRADHFRFTAAVCLAGEELLRRESLQGKFKPSSVYMSMAAATSDSKFAMDCLQRAESDLLNRRERIGTLLVSQLNLRLQRGEAPEAQRLLERIRRQHMNEPGVSDLLVSVMSRYGLVRSTAAQQQSMTAAAPPASAETTSQREGTIWTPDGGQSPQDEQKSKIWLPGAD